MVIFPTRILYCDSDSPAILGFFLSFEARTCSTVALCNICRANGKPHYVVTFPSMLAIIPRGFLKLQILLMVMK